MDMKNIGEIKYMTDNNDSLGSYVYIAELLGEAANDIRKKLEILLVKRDLLNRNPDPDLTYVLYRNLLKVARDVLSPEMYEAVYGAT